MAYFFDPEKNSIQFLEEKKREKKNKLCKFVSLRLFPSFSFKKEEYIIVIYQYDILLQVLLKSFCQDCHHTAHAHGHRFDCV